MGIARNIARLIPNGSGLLPNANIEAVAASKLTGQVPDANAPSGSVIQVVHIQSTGNFTASGAGTVIPITTLEASITPSSASNRLIITLHADFQQNNLGDTHIFLGRNSNGAGWVEAISGSSVPLTTAGNDHVWLYLYGGASGVGNAVMNGHSTSSIIAGTTGTILFRPYIGVVSGGPMTFGLHARTRLIVQEISA